MKCCAVVLFALGVMSSAKAADLMDIYHDAEASDSKLASAKMQREAGLEKRPQGRAGLLPTLSLTGSDSYNKVDATQPSNRTYGYNSNSYALQLTQPLFRYQNWIVYKQGGIQASIAEAQYISAQMDLMQRTAQAYFDLLSAQDVLKTVKTLRAAAYEQLQLSSKSFKAGTVTVTDVNDAQARYDLASAQEIAAQSDVDIKRENIRVLIHKAPSDLASLRQGISLDQAPVPADPDSWASSAMQDNLDVQVQQLTAEVARLDVQRAQAARLPTVDLVGSYGRTNAGASTTSVTQSTYKNWSVGVQASVPLFQGGALTSKVRESRAMAEKAKDDLDSVQRTAVQQARQSFLGVTSGIAQIKGYEAAVISSASAVEANKLGYKVGVKINMDVLNAQSQLADASQKLAKARYDTIMAKIKLKQSVGALSVKDLEEVNSLLLK